MRKTPLLELHKELGASIGEFAGVRTAISFSSIIEEHLSVRREAGIFDLSHMALIRVRGGGSGDLLEKLLSKRLSKYPSGHMIGPALFLNERGGIKDDVMTYKLSDGDWVIVGNAANLNKDVAWLESNASLEGYHVEISVLNEEYSLLALQGPRSPKILSSLFNVDVDNVGPLRFRTDLDLGGASIWIMSRSGWTGEDGFEFILRHSDAGKLFRTLVENSVKPCGLAARDSLRLEMGYYLYGHEIDEDVNPIEARYWMAMDLGKIECVGCDIIRSVYERGVDRVLVGLRFSKKDRAVPRQGNGVYIGERRIGYITSGGYSPTIGRSIALAFLYSRNALMGSKVHVDIRGRAFEAKVVDYPFIPAGRQAK